MEYLASYISLGIIALMAAMSPGPDFAIVTRHALTASRKSALLASLGVSSAILIHVTYCILGVAIILQESVWLFHTIKIAGALYLAYLGVKLLTTSSKGEVTGGVSLRRAFWSGFLTNLLNPKATLFILSIFSQFVKPGTPVTVEIIYGLIIAGAGLLWFSSLSFLITHSFFRPHFTRFQRILTRGMGVALLLLAIVTIIS